MYSISVGWPGGKYISRNNKKGVLSNVIIILRYIILRHILRHDVCMRCLGDVSRGVCEVTQVFLFEFSCCCGLERDTWMI